MAKKLVINCATCDARKVTEEKLAAYEEIVINAAVIFTNAESRALMDRYPVTLNCAQVADMEGDIQVRTVNGHAEIKSTDVPAKGKCYLIVNGSVDIEAGTEKVLEQYEGIFVNGSVTYPESIGGCLRMMTINGSGNCYPDGAVVLKKNAVIDRTFALRAKSGRYWTKKRLIMVDEKLDAAALAAKGVTFESKEAIVAESKVEMLVPLIDEKTDIIVVPDGTSVITDDVELDDTIIKRYGEKLYILGDLMVRSTAAEALQQLKWLTVQGDVKVAEELKEKLLLIEGNISGKVSVLFGGRQITDKISARVTKWMLEHEEDGLLVCDCVTVKIDADVPKELIMERLQIVDCVTVTCSAEQEDTVTAICEDVVQIGPEKGGIGGIIQDALGLNVEEDGILKTAGKLLNNKVVNASEYVL